MGLWILFVFSNYYVNRKLTCIITDYNPLWPFVNSKASSSSASSTTSGSSRGSLGSLADLIDVDALSDRPMSVHMLSDDDDQINWNSNWNVRCSYGIAELFFKENASSIFVMSFFIFHDFSIINEYLTFNLK